MRISCASLGVFLWGGCSQLFMQGPRGAYSHRKMSLSGGKRIKGAESPFWGFPALGADQREARGAGKLRCVFPSKNGFGFGFGFGFDLPGAVGWAPTSGRRKAGASHAVRVRFTLPSSLRLACCMASAASVSDCSWAKRSSSARVTPGCRKRSQPGSSRNNSKGVAQRR